MMRFLLAPLMLLTGCATIMHGTCQTVGISSYPSDASVWVDGNFIGRSPALVNLTRKDNHFVRIELEGYESYEMTLTHGLSGWVVGNLVFGGIIGLAVDGISGGIYKLTPDQVQVELRKDNCVAKQKSEGLYIAAVLKPDPAWEKIGCLAVSTPE